MLDYFSSYLHFYYRDSLTYDIGSQSLELAQVHTAADMFLLT